MKRPSLMRRRVSKRRKSISANSVIHLLYSLISMHINERAYIWDEWRLYLGSFSGAYTHEYMIDATLVVNAKVSVKPPMRCSAPLHFPFCILWARLLVHASPIRTSNARTTAKRVKANVLPALPSFRRQLLSNVMPKVADIAEARKVVKRSTRALDDFAREIRNKTASIGLYSKCQPPTMPQKVGNCWGSNPFFNISRTCWTKHTSAMLFQVNFSLTTYLKCNIFSFNTVNASFSQFSNDGEQTGRNIWDIS